MAFAAYLAGRAIDISRTTACHAVSYELTRLLGTPHGLAVALTLPAMLQFNARVTEQDACDPRGARYMRTQVNQIIRTLGATDPDQAAHRLKQWVSDLGCAMDLTQAGATPQIIDALVEAADPVRLSNNPRRLQTTDIRNTFTALL